MGKPKIILTQQDLEDFIVQTLQREVLAIDHEIDLWKSAYIIVLELQESIQHTLLHWKKASNFQEMGGKILDFNSLL